ncbi:nonspecific lipid-transfer protein [Striga asiatica]|uniref:Nonspecific lipid-transfer protein n=1 Tax=Striga asiatica TaxID=4170 RepID=A0A5A7RD90_STRAF|nr:nonspecific lipid-transfer protein [Striga asiatica]
MAPKKFEIGFIVILAFVLCRGAFAQSSCASTLFSLYSCMNYVTGNTSSPTPSCCSSLSNVVDTQPQCLCPLVNGGGSSFGFSINQTLAMALPAVCNVQTPPLSRCNGGVEGPTSAPGPSPLSSPTDGSTEPADTPSTNSDPSMPSGGGSRTVPATNASTSNRSYAASLIQLTVLALFIYNCLDS